MEYSGKIHFDKQGDGIYDYEIWQRQPDGHGGYQTVVIGQWLHEERKLVLNMEILKWFTLNSTLHPIASQLPKSVCLIINFLIFLTKTIIILQLII